MKRKSNKFQFVMNGEFLEPVKLAKSFIPQWYKDIKPFGYSKVEFGGPTGNQLKRNIKNCVPFLDALTAGYMITSMVDLYVESAPDNTKLIKWTSPLDPVADRDIESNVLPLPSEFSANHFVWRNKTVLKTPPGYSSILTHPFNRFDLPFLTLTGIVDTDSVMHNGNVPFFIKSDFEGLIPAGTPIIQVIPFRRESWTLEENKALLEENEKLSWNVTSSFFNYYRNNMWHKKDYQ